MNNKKNLEILRHSTSHLMAAAVLELFPGAKFGIGPVIENGFYYDFELPKNLTPEDLSTIEKKMKELAAKNLKFERLEMTIDEAIDLFKKLNQPYKIELLNDLKKYGTTKIDDQNEQITEKSNRVSIYRLGNFIDLCRGPHLNSTKEIGAFKLLKIAGAYWRGDEKNKMLQRIYGLAFVKQKELDDYLKLIEEAEKRDHRKIGQELDLFSFDEAVGAGLPLWHPKGAMLRQIIEDFWIKEHLKNGYQLVRSPHIGNLGLWKTSGHWEFYRENMYSPIKIEEDYYLIKPMNCPFHVKIFQNKMRSYRDLPFRWAELGTVYRFEKSGVLHGLVRVRGFTQDDAHTFCTSEQLYKEIENTVCFGIKMLKTFGFKNYDIYLSTRPEKYVGSLKIWEKATGALKQALEKLKLKYQIDPGAGVFYGPKIDIKIKDTLGRAWQCTTIQVDFNMPERFQMTYIDKKGKKAQPIMIHRALLGSLERFVGVLLEHYAGALPVWLSPIQVYITPVSKTHRKAAEKLAKELESLDIRCQVDILNETIPYKIRKAEKQKIPYILVIGDKEAKGKTLNVRRRGNVVKRIAKKQFINKILKEIKEKK
ncbi:MAG: threonine--tRNA ligase [Minisyncoccia bacterium]